MEINVYPLEIISGQYPFHFLIETSFKTSGNFTITYSFMVQRSGREIGGYIILPLTPKHEIGATRKNVVPVLQIQTFLNQVSDIDAFQSTPKSWQIVRMCVLYSSYKTVL